LAFLRENTLENILQGGRYLVLLGDQFDLVIVQVAEWLVQDGRGSPSLRGL
jgi:hypothetical protein